MRVYFIQLLIAVGTIKAKSVEHYGHLAACHTNVKQHWVFQPALTNTNTNADLKEKDYFLIFLRNNSFNIYVCFNL